jgi:hypothetical protein
MYTPTVAKRLNGKNHDVETTGGEHTVEHFTQSEAIS